MHSSGKSVVLIPYQSNTVTLPEMIESLDRDVMFIIMHQGVKGAFMGDYVQDKSSVDPELFKHHKVISGHYHRHQTVGTVTYIGSPYTTSFGEANDGPKGYLIVNEDGTFERQYVPTRRHIILSKTVKNVHHKDQIINEEDMAWVKVTGRKSELDQLDKNKIGVTLNLGTLTINYTVYMKIQIHQTYKTLNY